MSYFYFVDLKLQSQHRITKTFFFYTLDVFSVRIICTKIWYFSACWLSIFTWNANIFFGPRLIFLNLCDVKTHKSLHLKASTNPDSCAKGTSCPSPKEKQWQQVMIDKQDANSTAHTLWLTSPKYLQNRSFSSSTGRGSDTFYLCSVGGCGPEIFPCPFKAFRFGFSFCFVCL